MFPGVGGSLAFMRGSASFLFFPVGRPGCIGVGIVVPLPLGVPGVLFPGPVVFLGGLADFADLAAFALAWLVAPSFAVALAFFALAVLALAVLALGLLSPSLRAWLREIPVLLRLVLPGCVLVLSLRLFAWSWDLEKCCRS